MGSAYNTNTTFPLDIPFLSLISEPTLNADTTIGGKTLTLDPGHGLTTGSNAGDILELADLRNGSHFMQANIVTVVADVVTLDSPINRVYTVDDSLLSVSTDEMNVDGSVTPVVFSIKPNAVQKGDITRVIAEMRDASAMDFETFGGITALTNGCLMRIKLSDGNYRNIWNFKSNGDIIEQAFDHSFFENIGGGTRGFTSRMTWNGDSKHGTAIRLTGDESTSLEFVIQDDLTGLTRMHWTAQGKEI